MDKLPTDGDIDQSTLMLFEPATLAEKVVDCPLVSEAAVGDIVTDTTGDKET